MIREEDVIYIGRITRYRGIIGEVELQFTNDAFDRGEAEYLVLNRDGILVPYFWEEYRFKNDSTLILKLVDIDTEAAAKRLVGAEVFYPAAAICEEDADTLPSLKALVGFEVCDQQGRSLGRILNVDDSSVNILLSLSSGHLIPYHDDFLLHYDLQKKVLQLNLPEGILDLI